MRMPLSGDWCSLFGGMLMPFDALTLFGLFAVSTMLLFYALEDRSPWFVFAFAIACALAAWLLVGCGMPQEAEVSGFRHQIIDPNPNTGKDCCTDVLMLGDINGDGQLDVIVGAEQIQKRAQGAGTLRESEHEVFLKPLKAQRALLHITRLQVL